MQEYEWGYFHCCYYPVKKRSNNEVVCLPFNLSLIRFQVDPSSMMSPSCPTNISPNWPWVILKSIFSIFTKTQDNFSLPKKKYQYFNPKQTCKTTIYTYKLYRITLYLQEICIFLTGTLNDKTPVLHGGLSNEENDAPLESGVPDGIHKLFSAVVASPGPAIVSFSRLIKKASSGGTPLTTCPTKNSWWELC